MIEITAKSEGHLKRLINNKLPEIEFPCTVKIKAGLTRNAQQNNLQHHWIQEAAEQLKDETAEDKRAYCKLHGGVPILRAEDEEFREQYDKIIRPLPYYAKIELMKVPIDFPVTRLMKVKQFRQYLDWMSAHFSEQGVHLTTSMDGYEGW